MLLNTHPELRTQYDDELSLIRTIQIEGAHMDNLRSYTKHNLANAQRLQARRYLLMLEPMPDISVYDQLWLSMNWLPQVARLPLERVALLLKDKGEYNRMTFDWLLAVGRATFRFEIQFFDDSRSALRWLTDDSPRVAHLLAEWEDSCSAPTRLAPAAMPPALPELRFESRPAQDLQSPPSWRASAPRCQLASSAWLGR